jgi:hypothetical protein
LNEVTVRNYFQGDGLNVLLIELGEDRQRPLNKSILYSKLNAQRVLFSINMFQALKILLFAFSYGEFEIGGH